MRTLSSTLRLVGAAALLGCFSLGVSAAAVSYGDLASGQITLDASYALPRTGTPADGMATPPATIFQTPGNAGADMYLYTGTSDGNVFFHTYGFAGDTRYFGARASGQGSFFASTSTRYSQTFTNTSGASQLYSFDFYLSDGQVDMTGAGAGLAELLLQVSRIQGATSTTLASSWTQLSQGAAGARSCVDASSGALGSYVACDNRFAGGQSIQVDMGVLAPGESFTLAYDIMATVAGDLRSGNGEGYAMEFEACSGGIAPQAARTANAAEQAEPEPGGCAVEGWFVGEAIARSGDPFNGPQFGTGGPSDWQVAGLTVTATPFNAVPEPGTLALLGLAAVGLAATRRRTRRAL